MSTLNGAPPEAVRSQLDRILQSPGFADSPRLCRFLRYLVEEKLAGREADIKEYSVGLEAFDRPPSFDPKADSIVRATARKLRARLDEYYRDSGRLDPVIISIPKGGYVPQFAVAARIRSTGASRRWWPIAAATALVVTALTALGWRGSRLAEMPPSVAVLDVASATANDRDAWLSTALAEMIAEDLSANEGLRAVPAEQVAQLRRDWALSSLRGLVNQRGRELQDRLGANYAVLVEFRTGAGTDTLQVDTRLQRLRDGRVVLAATDSGAEAQLYSLTAQVARRIRLALRVPPGDAVPSLTGPDRDSMRLYSEAVVRLRESDPLAARTLLEKSAIGDPSNFLARSLLAETYFTLGMEAQAKIEAQAALALAPPLPPIERLALEARCWSAMRDWPAAVRSYRKLWKMSPEVIDYGLNLVDSQEKTSQFTEGLQTILAMRKQPWPLDDEARIDLAESLIRYRLGDSPRALALARQCQIKARRIAARRLYAQARLREGGLLMNLVQPGSLAALDDGLAICRERGYRVCEMNALRQEGNYYATWNGKRALELYNQGATLARQMGNRRGLVELLRGMAFVASHELLDREAEDRYRELAALIRDERLGDKAKEELDLTELLLAEGRLNDADQALRALATAFEPEAAWNLCMAELERNRGQLGSAARRAEAQIRAARKSTEPYTLLLALREAFQIHRDQGDLPRAADDLRQMEMLRSWPAVVSYSRAELALSRENWAEAGDQASAAEKHWQTADQAAWTGAALLRAEALTSEGRAAESLRLLEEIAPRLDQSRRVPWQVRARLCRFRAQTLLGACTDAAQFQDVSSAAQRLGIPWLSREVERAARLFRLKCGTAVWAAGRDLRGR